MRRLLPFAAAATLVAGCASGMRPVKQLETNQIMVGGGVNGPGAEFDPEFSLWLRWAPWTYVDVTAGALVTLPLFEPVAGGGMIEARGHVPLGPNLRLTLDLAGELIRYSLEGDGHVLARRITAMPLFVWTGNQTLTPYFGPKVMYLSHMDRVSSASFGSSPGFRESGAGVFMLGGTFGIEAPVDIFSAIGASIDMGVMVDAELGDLDGLYLSVAGYLGY